MALIWFQSGVAPPALAALVGCGGAVLGIWLTGLRSRIAVVVPFSAGVLIGVALFGLLPELAEDSSWLLTLALCAGGYGLLFLINRYAYPICPNCAHDHDHSACEMCIRDRSSPAAIFPTAQPWCAMWWCAARFHVPVRYAGMARTPATPSTFRARWADRPWGWRPAAARHGVVTCDPSLVWRWADSCAKPSAPLPPWI